MKPELMLAVHAGVLGCAMSFLFVYTIVYVTFFPAMMVVLAEGGSALKAIDPVHLWEMARPRFTEYLMVFLIVGIALITIILFLSAFSLTLLRPPMLVYGGLVTAHYAG